VVLEVDLHNLVAEPEHDGMFGPHPLLHVDRSGWWLVCIVKILVVFFFSNAERSTLLGSTRLKVRFEVLKQSHFLLQLLWEVGERILLKHILLFSLRNSLPLVVVETVAFVFDNNLSRVIEEDSRRLIGEEIAESILSRVVHPLGDPHRAHPMLANKWQLFSFCRLHHTHLWKQLVACRATSQRLSHWCVLVEIGITRCWTLQFENLRLLATGGIVLLDAYWIALHALRLSDKLLFCRYHPFRLVCCHLRHRLQLSWGHLILLPSKDSSV